MDTDLKQIIKNCEERNLKLEKMIESTQQAIKETDKKLNVVNKRIYSLNLASYLSARGYDYTLRRDEENPNLCYFIFDDDVSDLLTEYKQDANLQDFIRSYKKIKKELHNFNK